MKDKNNNTFTTIVRNEDNCKFFTCDVDVYRQGTEEGMDSLGVAVLAVSGTGHWKS